MVSDKKLANVVGGKTARACDNCIAKRARWYCAADDAFLCQGCDASVHSANPLARRHERVRLKTSSLKSSSQDDSNSLNLEKFVPPWHKGLTKKARTPRQGKQHRKPQSWHILVPEFETSNEENDEQLLYRVPIFDHFAEGDDKKTTKLLELGDGGKSFHGFLPSDMELAEFAADVESLLGKGLDEESFDMESLGLLDHQQELDGLKDGRVKVEDEVDMNNHVVDNEIDMTREGFEFNFDFDSPVTFEGEENFKVEDEVPTMEEEEESRVDEEDKKSQKKVLLRLDYGAVMEAWSSSERSPWTTGDRPELDSSECWPTCLGKCGRVDHHPYGNGGIGGHNRIGRDGGREARVSRYREKRRTRLFSKKIRYEVRKLNAEKRPRMKGRFVKRTNFAAPTSFPLLGK